MHATQSIAPATGRLGILLPGMGAVGSTLIAGSMLARKGLAKPIGSLTQMGTLRLGKAADNRFAKIADFVPLAKLDDVAFGGWDLFAQNAYESACEANVLSAEHLNAVKEELSAVKPMPSVFFPEYVKRLRGENIKQQGNKKELAEALRQDIRAFKDVQRVERCVAVWCGSTESASRDDRSSSIAQRFRARVGQQRSRYQPLHDLRLCLLDGRGALRQWLPELKRGDPGALRARA